MRIILSPAKRMRVSTDILRPLTRPVFPEETKRLMRWMQGLSYAEAKKLWACNDKIARENYERFAGMDLEDDGKLTPAVLAYDGIAFQYMAPAVFEDGHFDYVQEHLRILSGFYGVVRAMDGVVPYRLEMGAKWTGTRQGAKKGTGGDTEGIAGAKDLYEYWGSKLYEAVTDESHLFINLASKEYSVCIERYLQPEDRFITCVFGEFADAEQKKIVTKGVYAKMARGDMVRFMAENRIEDPEALKEYDRLGYAYLPERSDELNYVYIRRTA